MDELAETFADPGADYRGKPFWAWNGRLDEDELRRQIRIMHRMGLGGFFMHSRVGLATPYLSTEWFHMVRACIDEAEKLDMEAWLYDEDRWPSGAAGGLATRQPEFRQRMLHMVVVDSREVVFAEQPLAVFSAVVDGHNATEVRRLDTEEWTTELEPENASVLAFLPAAAPPNAWFNDYTYLDTMNHEAVQRFIQLTHEAYRKHCGDRFSTVVPGIFTDEPNYGVLFRPGRAEGRDTITIPWTDGLPRRFKERYGYDILDFLPHLFFNVDGEELSHARYHYFDCATFLFVDAFSRQIGDWCGRFNVLLTGHALRERTLRGQTAVCGAAMRFYEFMQAPGMDLLTEYSDEYTTAKQVASMVHQTGRRWMLSETYGCTGWDFPFEGHKAVGDWQAALGVNLRCQHLSWYTMSGQAKRDYPASIFFQSPWWPHYRKVEDYFARVGAVMSRGRSVQKLLVVHPIESMWARAHINWNEDPPCGKLEERFQQLTGFLLDGHVDFDYGDEEIMSRLARVESGPDATLHVGRARYDVVLVPPQDTVRASTLTLLREFRKSGGTVVFCDPVPGRVEVQPTARVEEFARSCTIVAFEREAILAAVEPARVVSIADQARAQKADVFYLLHHEERDWRLFLCNRDRNSATGPLTIDLHAEGDVQLWDAESGDRFAVSYEPRDRAVRFTTEMAASGSRLFVVTAQREQLPALPKLVEVRSMELAPARWSGELTEPNVFVLDRVEYRIDGGDWTGPQEILTADRSIRSTLELPQRGGRMVQPWAREPNPLPAREIALLYRFQVEHVPRGPVMLAMEDPHHFKISLNGHPLLPDNDCGWWVDPCIRLLPIDAGALGTGENVLIVIGRMREDTDLEICYLLGDFTVEADRGQARITGGRPEVGFGDWTQQGLPFYSGSILFRTVIRPELKEGERLFVEVPQFRGACVRVLVDTREAGVIGWPPHEVDITELVVGAAEATLAVEIVSHRRNAFGPLHIPEAHPRSVGPASFLPASGDWPPRADDYWQDEYQLVPCGCMTPPRLSVRRAE